MMQQGGPGGQPPPGMLRGGILPPQGYPTESAYSMSREAYMQQVSSHVSTTSYQKVPRSQEEIVELYS